MQFLIRERKKSHAFVQPLPPSFLYHWNSCTKMSQRRNSTFNCYIENERYFSIFDFQLSFENLPKYFK